MISIGVLLALLIVFWALSKATQSEFFKDITFCLFSAVLVETVVFAYLLFLIVKSQCFFLIGQDPFWNAAVKARLIYSTYYAQGKKSFINQVDHTLGYTLGKDKDTGLYRTNAQGIRADREYPLVAPPGVLRMVAVGDSYVFCDGESNENTWTRYLEESAGNLEVLNMGVPGYGLGQSYLRLLGDGLKFSPDIILVNYLKMTARDKISPKLVLEANDIRRAEFYRVRFWVENGELRHKAMTPFDLFDTDFRKEYLFDEVAFLQKHNLEFLRYAGVFNTGLAVKEATLKKMVPAGSSLLANEEQVDVQAHYKIIEGLIAAARAHNAQILFFAPGEKLLEKPIRKLIKKNSDVAIVVNSIEKILAKFKANGYGKLEDLYNYSNHFNPEGNRLYAETVLDVLKKRAWGVKKRKFYFDPKTNSFKNKKQAMARAGTDENQKY